MARPGRPSWKPSEKDRKFVKEMVAHGIAHETIAKILKITRMTLTKHCRYELNTGLAEATAAVAGSMFRMATKGPISMVKYQSAKFWLSARAGWHERQVMEVVPVPGEMTTEELDDLIERTQADIRAREAAWSNVATIAAHRPIQHS